MRELTKKQKQWAWFIGLCCGSFVAVLTLAYVIRWMMNVT